MFLFRLLSLCFVLVLLQACDQSTGDAKSHRPHMASSHLVETAVVDKGFIQAKRQYPALLRYRKIAKIYSEEEGKITFSPWFEGDAVNKNATLIKFDDRLFKADRQIAEANLRQATEELRRIQNLVNKKVASADALLKSKTALSIAKAELSQARTHFEHTVIKAPFDGIISQRLVDSGDVVSKHSHLLSLFSPASLIVEAEVPAFVLPGLHKGTVLSVKINALGKNQYSAKVSRIHPDIDPLTHKGKIEIRFDPIPEHAIAGQTAHIILDIQRPEQIIIPYKALRHDRQGAYVFVVKDNKAKRQPVSVGLQHLESIEAISGLHSGDEIVVAGFPGLHDGKTLNIKSAGTRSSE